jgi:hypothetical protein
MPKRVIDFDAMWGSDKLASCAGWAQAEYAWLYGLADASGCFELTNLRVIWGRVAAIRRNLTIERIEQIFDEFQDKGLLFVWEHEGKRYGHWTGSDVPGRLPAPSWRVRLERLAPPVPRQQFAEYMSRFARGRAALAGGRFVGETDAYAQTSKSENSHLKSQSQDAAPRSLKGNLEENQAEDWNWNSNREVKRKKEANAQRTGAIPGEIARMETETPQTLLFSSNSKSNSNAYSNASSSSENIARQTEIAPPQPAAIPATSAAAAGAAFQAPMFSRRDKWAEVARELAVGRGPCGPVKLRPEALERIRAREAARKGSRSP